MMKEEGKAGELTRKEGRRKNSKIEIKSIFGKTKKQHVKKHLFLKHTFKIKVF